MPTQVTPGAVRTPQRTVVYAYDRHSDRCRLVESFLAAALEGRTRAARPRLVRLEWGEQPHVAERLGVVTVPSVLVVEHGRAVARLDEPRDSRSLDLFLSRWLVPSDDEPGMLDAA